MDALIIFCATYLIWAILVAGVVYVFFTHELKRFVVSAVASLGLAFVLGRAAEMLWYNPRPFVVGDFAPLIPHAANNGFPSDHMLMAATIASIVFVYNRRLGVVLGAAAVAVGAARVLAGVHHVVDLAGAALIAVAVVALVEYTLTAFSRRHTTN